MLQWGQWAKAKLKKSKHTTNDKASRKDIAGGDVMRNDVPSTPSASFMDGVSNAQVNGGTISVVGRDLHNHYYQAQASVETSTRYDLNAVLPALNFRTVQVESMKKRTRETCLWLFNHSQFLEWRESNRRNAFLWLNGMPGAGKTVLASVVVDHFEKARKAGQDITVVYAFLRYTENHVVANILAALVRQILERHLDLHPLVGALCYQHAKENTKPSEEELVALLTDLCQACTTVVIVLDGLDEATNIVQYSLVSVLSSLDAKVFVTSRPLETLQAQFSGIYVMKVAADDDDLERHIEEKIKCIPEVKALLAVPEFKGEVVAKIREKAHGMFLHAALQVDALQGCLSIRDVREVLDEFPTQIEDAYAATLLRIEKQSRKRASLAKIALIWVLSSPYPMSVEALLHAVSLDPDTCACDPERSVSQNTLLSVCLGLLNVEDDEWNDSSQVVRLIHYTADVSLKQIRREWLDQGSVLQTKVCLRTLVDHGFLHNERDMKTNHDLDMYFVAVPFTYHAYYWFLAFASKSQQYPKELSNLVANFISRCTAFPFVRKPRPNPHCLHLSGTSTLSLRFDLLDAVHLAVVLNFPSILSSCLSLTLNTPTCIEEASPLLLACEYACMESLEILLQAPHIDVNKGEKDGCTPLMIAAWAGHTNVLKRLLTLPTLRVNDVDTSGFTPLTRAILCEQVECIHLLLDDPRTVVSSEGEGDGARRPLAFAADAFRVDSTSLHAVFQRILDLSSGFANQADSKGWTPIMYACDRGDKTIVEKLLTCPEVDVNWKDSEGRTPLRIAVSNCANHELSWGALQTRYERFGSLFPSPEGEHPINLDVIKVLLNDPRTDVNPIDSRGWTPLMLACEWGDASVVELLMACPRIDVNHTDSKGYSALGIALRRATFDPHTTESRARCVRAVKLVLSSHSITADLWTLSDPWWRPQNALFRDDHFELTTMLLSSAGDMHKGVIHKHLRNLEGNKPFVDALLPWGIDKMLDEELGTACWTGENVGWLLELGAGKDTSRLAQDPSGSPPLVTSAKFGYALTVQQLLEHNSDQIDLVNDSGDTALIAALINGHEEIAYTLLDYGADITIVNSLGQTALHAVCQGAGDLPELVTVLLERGADVNAIDNSGESPLIHASRMGFVKTAFVLISYGADVDLTNSDGDSPLTVACSEGHEAMIDLLTQHAR